MADTQAPREGNWLPLESNPDVLNPFVRRLGLPADWAFCDVFGLDDELLCMVPQPCVAVCLLYPSAKISQARRAAQRIAAAQQPPPPPELVFMMQKDGIGNACGTIACVHAIANGHSSGHFQLQSGPLLEFLGETKQLDAAGRGDALLRAKDLQELSDTTAAAGETEGAGTDDAQNSHFIAFVRIGGLLYELDGRNFDKEQAEPMAQPFCHGATSDATFLADAAKVIREDVIARDPTSHNFNVVALCQVPEGQ